MFFLNTAIPIFLGRVKILAPDLAELWTPPRDHTTNNTLYCKYKKKKLSL